MKTRLHSALFCLFSLTVFPAVYDPQPGDTRFQTEQKILQYLALNAPVNANPTFYSDHHTPDPVNDTEAKTLQKILGALIDGGAGGGGGSGSFSFSSPLILTGTNVSISTNALLWTNDPPGTVRLGTLTNRFNWGEDELYDNAKSGGEWYLNGGELSQAVHLTAYASNVVVQPFVFGIIPTDGTNDYPSVSGFTIDYELGSTATGIPYGLSGSAAWSINVTTLEPLSGDIAGGQIVMESLQGRQYGFVLRTEAQDNGQVNVPIKAVAVLNGKTGPHTAGHFSLTASSGGHSASTFDSAAVVIDSEGTGLPLMKGYLAGDPIFEITGTGDVNIANNLNVTGKITGGSIDPEWVLYDRRTRKQVAESIAKKVPKEKQGGAALFFNQETKRLEVYVKTDNAFYDLNGKKLE